MLFRQLFDAASCTYTYLLAGQRGGEALIIDPVIERVDHYLRLLAELKLKLIKAIDTHVHADHVSGLGALRDKTRCITVMGRASRVDVVSMRVDEGDRIEIEGVALDVIYTPGHTDDSYCFLMPDRVFTGDTLLIRGTGRTDFQNGDACAAYRSIFGKLMTLADETAVYPGHDYKGDTVSTIGEERAFNPRLQVASEDAYAELMANLHLPSPKQMDVAVPANLAIGFTPRAPAMKARSLPAAAGMDELEVGRALFVDLREESERARHGTIPGSVHIPYAQLDRHVAPAGLLATVAGRLERPLVLYCAFGERSALALATLDEAGIAGALHLAGGFDAWAKAGGPIAGGRQGG